MRAFRVLALFAALGLFAASTVHAQMQDPDIGAPAPAFTLPDTYGNHHSLSDYAGKWVVLEWLNYGCPFVQKFYDAGKMQELQAEYAAKDVVWFAVVSSAPGQQGYYEPGEMNAQNEAHGIKTAAVLLDPDGDVGRAYGAKTTPQMYLISPDGMLLYNGAIDNKPSANASSLEGATNYLVQAINEAWAGQPVSEPVTRPYGCSVKYKTP
jgi:peroxiredoxin